MVDCLTQYIQPFLVICKRFLKAGSNLRNIAFPCLLVVCKYGPLHLSRRYNLLYGRKKLLRNGTAFVGMLLFAALSYDGVDKFDYLLIYLVGLENSFDHLLLRNLVGSRFNHDHLFSGRGYCKSHIGSLFLSGRRIDHELAVHEAYLGSCAGAVKWNI